MSADLALVPAPVEAPAPPCPTWAGAAVRWEAWEPSPRITHIDPSCDACGFPGPLQVACGYVQGLSRASHTVPDTGLLRLSAHACPRCRHMLVFEALDHGGTSEAAPAILCDGCDALCGVGATLEEARAALVALGGWTDAGGADWDLCRRCNLERAGDSDDDATTAAAAPNRRDVEEANREGKAKAIALYCWRLAMTPDDWIRIQSLPYSSRKRSEPTLRRFAQAAYATSPREEDRQRQPPHSRRSRTWQLVVTKLDRMTALEAGGDIRVPERDLLEERGRWGLDPVLADANTPDQAERASDREEDADRTGGTGADRFGAGLSHGYTGTGPHRPAVTAPAGTDASPTPSLPALPAGVIACGPGPLTAGDADAVREFAEQLRELRSATAPEETAPPRQRQGQLGVGAEPDGTTPLPRGWAELAALPPLDYGHCIHHPGQRPVVITPDGGRCATCPPCRGEIPVRWDPTPEQLSALFGSKKGAEDVVVPFSSVRDGWGIHLDWTPRHCNAPVRCYCGRCPAKDTP